MKHASRQPRLQVLPPSGKNPRSVERFGIYMAIGMFLLGVYGQYAGRGAGIDLVPSRPGKTPVFEFQHLSANPAERTASAGEKPRQDKHANERDEPVGIRL
ncbi:hypothetical protein [Pseudomonas sp. LFM046]|uniref:hypothetical protein n=1 Tax=Pseudomonas sp. LFM046 TaxID=1608357 RepID=UPI0005CFD598|nr:hypothetical protein [Pseudomonas sp. LFM046]